MNIATDRQGIALAVFKATGERLPEDDPIILAALFYADTLRSAGREASTSIMQASAITSGALQDARVLAQNAVADRKQLACDIGAEIERCVKIAGRVHSTDGHRLIPAWFAAVTFFAGALVFAGAAGLLTGSLSWAHDASVGREFARIRATIDPATRDKLIEAAQRAMEK